MKAILKVYQQQDLKGYRKEKEILTLLQDKLMYAHPANKEIYASFPYIISHKVSPVRAEILMKELGPDLRQLQRSLPDR